MGEEEKFVGRGTETRTFLYFKVSVAALREFVPDGWQICPVDSGPAAGANLLAVFVDHADFADPDAFVDANAVVTSGRTVVSDDSSSQAGWFSPTGAGAHRSFRWISASASAMNASTARGPRSPPDRLRTETVPSAASRSPVTSM